MRIAEFTNCIRLLSSIGFRLSGGIFLMSFLVCTGIGCKSSGKIKTKARHLKNDTTLALVSNPHLYKKAVKLLREDELIDFSTFSGSAKVEYQDTYGKQPEATAHIRMIRDEAIWVSLTASFLNIEGARILITPDSIVIVNKLDKTIQARSISYIREKLSLPLTFDDVQRLILGKTILAGDSIQSVFSSEKFLRFTSNSNGIDDDIYYTASPFLLTKQLLRILSPGSNYSAEVLYENYEKNGKKYFSTRRDIAIPELEQYVRLTFRQYEFNKELSMPFTRPEGYKIK